MSKPAYTPYIPPTGAAGPVRLGYTIEEAAQVISTSPTNIKELIRRGELAAAPVGARSKGQRNDYRITPWALEEFLRRREAAQGIEIAAQKDQKLRLLEKARKPGSKGRRSNHGTAPHSVPTFPANSARKGGGTVEKVEALRESSPGKPV